MAIADLPEAPRAPKKPVTRSHHGRDFVDDYEWLREKESPEVIAHLEAENAFTELTTRHLEGLRQTIFDEIKGRVQETDLGVATREGSYWYYSRTAEGKQYGIQCRLPIDGPDDWTPPTIEAGVPAEGEQVIFDGNIEAEGHDFFSLGSFDVSPDGRLLAFGVDLEGDERYTLRIRDLVTGTDLRDEIRETAPGATFDASGRYLFYPTVDESWRPDTIWRHEVGSTGDDVSIFHEADDRYWIGIGLTRSHQYLVIEAGSKITSETWILDASDPTGEFRVVWPRREGIEYEVDHAIVDGSDRLLVLHNEGAVGFELVDVPADDPASTTDRRVVLPHRADRRLESVDAFAGHLLIDFRADGLSQIGIVPLPGDNSGFGALEVLEFDEALFTAGWAGNPEFTQATARYVLSSFVTPTTIADLEVATGERRILKQQVVLGDYDAADYEQSREWATAADGTRVPISLVWKRDAVTLGTPSPVHLYGYGSYEHSIDPAFSVARLSLLDRGVVFAVAHVRGGGEMGREWYENGKTLTKRNTFTDFVAVADHLIAEGRTTPAQLVAEGGSAGGLLMGAVANLAPDRFAAILAAVPFVDALTSILDPDLPLTVIEWDEWGDPLHDPEVYDYMATYTPYENVADDASGYPKILAVTSLNDTRVLYVEPAKWVARLRDAGAPASMKIEMQAGHGGVSGRYESWRERAFEIAWLLEVLGLAGDVSATDAAVSSASTSSGS
ncbi:MULTISPECIES: S9 family peptidase [unclassified Frondihabitans]|uniref:S9 family peptidase n=1 Tax=unclassified Frondihabitans TaxID=2626248 RepID=UPI000F4E5286|nr:MULTISPECIES: S9 family peptidase [unclassified Frondihabitans]RPE76554.1 oligopeptidase B [Frondihabitans sp. PhB153]RPF05171.1 oligopeptidase B [Frondihabitans sp. PhB161]